MQHANSNNLTTDTANELYVLGLDRNSSSIDSTKIGSIKELNKVVFSEFLYTKDSFRLVVKPKIAFIIPSKFTNCAVERELRHKKIC